MTCREKWMISHPYQNFVIEKVKCPSTYGYMEDPETEDIVPGEWECCMDCNDCWDREIPGTEELKKEKPMTTKKTKAELLDEIDKLKKQVNDLERYKQYEDMAGELKAMHTAFMNSGFSNDQAYDLLKTLTAAALPAAMRGN